jgi:hypothetical protein
MKTKNLACITLNEMEIINSAYSSFVKNNHLMLRLSGSTVVGKGIIVYLLSDLL